MSYDPFQPFVPILDRIDPKLVTKRGGLYSEVLVRHQNEALMVEKAGRPGLEKVARFLFRRATDERMLRFVFDYEREGGWQAPGPDGLHFEDLNEEFKLGVFCCNLRGELRSGDYRPGAEWLVQVPKDELCRPAVAPVQNLADRVVQRAVLNTLEPLIDPQFGSHVFSRPGPDRSELHAMALSQWYALKHGRSVWLTQRIQNASQSVSIPLLLPIVRQYCLSDDLTNLVGRILGGASVPGLRFGTPLSELLVKLYLHHYLDLPWKKDCPNFPLIRCRNCILVPCRSVEEAKRARAHLLQLLKPVGMAFRESAGESVGLLTKECPADWLGCRIDRTDEVFRYCIADNAWAQLAQSLMIYRHEPDADEAAVNVVNNWLTQMAPASKWENLRKGIGTLDRVKEIASKYGYDNLPRRDKLTRFWKKKADEWHKIKHTFPEYTPDPRFSF